MDQGPSQLMLQRTLHTPADLHDHAQRVGIRLHSNIGPRNNTTLSAHSSAHVPMSPRSLQTYIAQRGIRLHRAKSSPSYHSSFNVNSSGQSTEYIQNVITPLSYTDSSNVRTLDVSVATGGEDSENSYNQGQLSVQHLHQRQKSAKSMPAVLPGNRPQSKLTVSAVSAFDAASRDGCSVYSATDSTWSKSPQAQRFISEQHGMAKTRTLKRTSEIRSHRVDKMYYMRGSPMQVLPRYYVGESEKRRLHQLRQTQINNQKNYRYGHSGIRRPASNDGCESDHHLLRQPPPSSVTGYTTADDARTVHTKEDDLSTVADDITIEKEEPDVTAASLETQPDSSSNRTNVLPEVPTINAAQVADQTFLTEANVTDTDVIDDQETDGTSSVKWLSGNEEDAQQADIEDALDAVSLADQNNNNIPAVTNQEAANSTETNQNLDDVTVANEEDCEGIDENEEEEEDEINIEVTVREKRQELPDARSVSFSAEPDETLDLHHHHD